MLTDIADEPTAATPATATAAAANPAAGAPPIEPTQVMPIGATEPIPVAPLAAPSGAPRGRRSPRR